MYNVYLKYIYKIKTAPLHLVLRALSFKRNFTDTRPNDRVTLVSSTGPKSFSVFEVCDDRGESHRTTAHGRKSQPHYDA